MRRATSQGDRLITVILDAARNDIPLSDSFSLARIYEWLGKERRNLDIWVIDVANDIAAVAVLKEANIFYLAVAPDSAAAASVID